VRSQSRRQLLRSSLALVGLGLAAGCGLMPPPTRSASRIPTIGYLSPLATPTDKTALGALEVGLRDLGYSEGQNLHIERRFADGQPERLPGLAADLVDRRVDVLVALGAAILPARDATSTIPIVMVNASEPVTSGLEASLAHPGGNLTGMSIFESELSAKRLELLKQATPSVSAVLVLGRRSVSDDTRASATALGLRIDAVGLDNSDDLERAFASLTQSFINGLMVYGQTVTVSLRTRIADLAVGARLPLMGDRALFAQAGGLLSYGSNDGAALRRAGAFVDKIVKGAKPADLPIEQPTTFDFVINLRTAQAIGLNIPESILSQATEIIQ
jgi:putative ABC transport system substrate-binding protein